MAKKVILSLIFLSLIVFPLVNAVECYQEFANESTECGGLDTGIYSSVGNWNDGDWSTFISDDASYYVNYTKPTDSISALWMVKDNGATVNLSIPSDCWNYDADSVLFRIREAYDTPFINWSCYNGDWYQLRYDTSDPSVAYEEAIIWNITASPSPTPVLDNEIIIASGYGFSSLLDAITTPLVAVVFSIIAVVMLGIILTGIVIGIIKLIKIEAK